MHRVAKERLSEKHISKANEEAKREEQAEACAEALRQNRASRALSHGKKPVSLEHCEWGSTL